MKWIPRSLGGQLAILLIAAVIAAQIVGLLIFTGDRADAVRAASRAGLLENMGSVMRVLAVASPGTRADLAKAASTHRVRYWVTEQSPVALEEVRPNDGRKPFDRIFDLPMREDPRVVIIDDSGERISRSPSLGHRGPRDQRADERYDVLASVPFPDGGWFNAKTSIREERIDLPWPSIISTIVTAVAILIIVGVMARRVTRPLANLADRVEAFGRGATPEPLPEAGPSEVRRLTGAFNLMQERLERFISDRTRMLAAVGHDLRTPITSLRLRAELLEDEEARTRMLATLDDMQRMAEAALAFARDDATSEPARSVDLAALIESLVDDRSELGNDVVFANAERFPFTCRPTAIKRAVSNIIENAVRYGHRARVSLEDADGGPVIRVDDDGPGIPGDRTDDVFKPFLRLETSRSRETGGVGLGLAIARSIVLAHGGEITLTNRSEGGLRVEIRLPPIAR